jgi:hypothetical protein
VRKLDLTKSDDDEKKTRGRSETADTIARAKSGTPVKIKEEKQ